MTAKKASLDEFMSKREQRVGKTDSGREVVFKGLAAPPSWNKDARSAQFIMSSETVDRDGDIVRQKGLQTDKFMENPQALLFHSSRSWPVGKWSDVTKKVRAQPPRTEGTLTFAPEGGPIPEVDQAAWAVENDLIRTVSIGFMPLDLELIEHPEDSGVPWGYGFDILASELYECSLVPIPAQPDARVKGMIARNEMSAAREFVEQALDDWAKDPRTGMLVPKKELEGIYARFFGKQGPLVMAIDVSRPRDKAVLPQIHDALASVAEKNGMKDLMPVPVETDGGDAGGEIEATTGIEIEFPITVNLTITQGNTGAATRVGTDVGDEVTGAADPNAQQQQRAAAVPAAKQRERSIGIFERIGKMLGWSATETVDHKPAPQRAVTRDDAAKTLQRLQARLQEP